MELSSVNLGAEFNLLAWVSTWVRCTARISKSSSSKSTVVGSGGDGDVGVVNSTTSI